MTVQNIGLKYVKGKSVVSFDIDGESTIDLAVDEMQTLLSILTPPVGGLPITKMYIKDGMLKVEYDDGG